jgi:hypothetical protein
LSALPMFVPSLSCKMMHLYTNGAKKVAFLYRDLTVEVPVRAYTLMQKTVLLSSISCRFICPEPVLVNGRFSCRG